MNNAMLLRKRNKTSHLTRVILLVSFIILLARLIYVVPGAIQHHQQKKLSSETPVSVVK
ncbi:YfgG family protein [Erwinia tasmaniensis]|uniref:YfgG family protein n=1 Tax=Erwinia tasmaniensis TaxID=338565 RepID=UPI0002DA4B3A|nr:YfgG family protein [Erwinia tasmaniensis]